MNRLRFTLITLLAVFLASAAGAAVIHPSDRYITRPAMSMAPIRAIVASSLIKVEYTRDSHQRVEIYAPDNIIDFVKLTYRAGTLSVAFETEHEIRTEWNGKPNSGQFDITVRIWAADVSAFRAKSLANIAIHSPLDVKGSCDFECESSASIRSKSGVKATGNVTADCSSTGQIVLGDIDCRDIEIKSQGVGSISVGSMDADMVTLNAQSTGSIMTGDILGRKSVQATVFSTGKIRIGKVVTHSLQATMASIGKLKIESANCESIVARCTSGGSVEMEGIAATTVTARSSGTGSIELEGDCTEAEYSASEAATINAEDLRAAKVVATSTSNVAKISCTALDSFSGFAFNQAVFDVSGNPREYSFTPRG